MDVRARARVCEGLIRDISLRLVAYLQTTNLHIVWARSICTLFGPSAPLNEPHRYGEGDIARVN